MENDLRSSTLGNSHFDGSPGRNLFTRVEDLHDCFFGRESFGQSRGSSRAVTATLQFMIGEQTSAIAIPERFERLFDFRDGLNVDPDEGTFHHGWMIPVPLTAREGRDRRTIESL